MIKRDENSNAVLSTDAIALNKYKVERSYYKKVDKLHADILDIKQTIIRICEKIEELESRQKENG